MILVTKWFGTFLVDGDKVVRERLFGDDPKEMALKLAAIQRGEVLDEERALVKGKVKVAEPRLSPLGRPVVIDSSFIRPEDHGYTQGMMHEVMIELGRVRTREPIAKDKNIVQAIRSLDDVIETSNLMSERLHEWYGLHFPELADHAQGDRYAELISKHGSRDGIIDELELDVESVGSELSGTDEGVLISMAGTLCDIQGRRRALESYLSEQTRDCAPNLAALLSENLAARLISLAGGLERLASLPSSTVQLLGAEKAMFRHLRSGKAPPKHGIIFQHPLIHRSPWWQRGNIARALASKASIAARVDNWNGEFCGDRLVSELEERVEEIRRKYPNPPKRKRASRKGQGGRRRRRQ